MDEAITTMPLPAAESSVLVGNLDFSYHQRHLFSSFSLHSGTRPVVLKGPSGCGKTTLLRLIFGSLKPTAPAILPAFSRPILILQEDGLFPWMTGRSNIEIFLPSASQYLQEHPLFETVRAFIDRHCYQMSYGQRRAIELFRALLGKPDALLLDEPFNYLDDVKASALIDYLLSTHCADLRLVITTHRHDTSLDAASDVYSFEGPPPYASLRRIA